MKKILMILAVFSSLTVFGQREYTYNNKGINLFLEGEGAGSREFGIGGIALTVGYQFNPHIFFGGGVATKFGGDRDFKREVREDLGWYDEATKTYHSDYYIDETGTYHAYQSSYYINECGEGGFSDMFMDFFIDFRYNLLATTRYTPYVDIRSGFYAVQDDGSSVFEDVLIGCRFGCGEGDFAITAGAGYTFRRLDYEVLNNQHMFLLRLGVEF